MVISGVGATPEPQKNTTLHINQQEQKQYSIFDYEDVNDNGEIDEKDFNNDNAVIKRFKDKGIFGQKWTDVEKAEIKLQYPYYTQEDIDARYEIAHMKYRSAEIMEALHSGKRPSDVLREYNETISQIKDGKRHEKINYDWGGGCEVDSTYDDKNRILSRRKVQNNENGGGVSESTYEYFADGSYIKTFNEETGVYVYKYDKHGKMIESSFNGEPDEIPEKCEGDLTD